MLDFFLALVSLENTTKYSLLLKGSVALLVIFKWCWCYVEVSAADHLLKNLNYILQSFQKLNLNFLQVSDKQEGTKESV